MFMLDRHRCVRVTLDQFYMSDVGDEGFLIYHILDKGIRSVSQI